MVLSYRHAFHAGNHADVLKHVVLVQILDYMRSKPKPIWHVRHAPHHSSGEVSPHTRRYVETHAGAGVYDLSSARARQNSEHEQGVKRIFAAEASVPIEVRTLVPSHDSNQQPRCEYDKPQTSSAISRR
jgi:23S rRNA (adenine2030-N6)-methyltransferase